MACPANDLEYPRLPVVDRPIGHVAGTCAFPKVGEYCGESSVGTPGQVQAHSDESVLARLEGLARCEHLAAGGKEAFCMAVDPLGRVDVDTGNAGLDEGAAGGAGHRGMLPTLPHVAVKVGEVRERAGVGAAGEAAGEPFGFGVEDAAGGGPVAAVDVAGPDDAELLAALVDTARFRARRAAAECSIVSSRALGDLAW